jgi:hypothetical protein
LVGDDNNNLHRSPNNLLIKIRLPPRLLLHGMLDLFQSPLIPEIYAQPLIRVGGQTSIPPPFQQNPYSFNRYDGVGRSFERGFSTAVPRYSLIKIDGAGVG